MIICKSMDRVWHNYLYTKCSISSACVDKISSLCIGFDKFTVVLIQVHSCKLCINKDQQSHKKAIWIQVIGLYIKLAFAAYTLLLLLQKWQNFFISMQ